MLANLNKYSIFKYWFDKYKHEKPEIFGENLELKKELIKTAKVRIAQAMLMELLSNDYTINKNNELDKSDMIKFKFNVFANLMSAKNVDLIKNVAKFLKGEENLLNDANFEAMFKFVAKVYYGEKEVPYEGNLDLYENLCKVFLNMQDVFNTKQFDVKLKRMKNNLENQVKVKEIKCDDCAKAMDELKKIMNRCIATKNKK